MEDGGLPQAMSDQDVAGGLAQLKWRPCPSEDGGPVTMEVPWLKQQAAMKNYREITAEIDRIGK